MGRKRTEEKEPLVRGKLIAAYAKTGTMRGAAELVGVTDKTVTAIFERNPDDFSAANKFACRAFHSDADACRRKSMEPERLEKCSSPQLAVMAGIYTDKGLQHQERVEPTGLDIDILRSVALALKERKNSMTTINVTAEEVNHAESHDAPEEVSQDGEKAGHDAGRDAHEHGHRQPETEPVPEKSPEGPA